MKLLTVALVCLLLAGIWPQDVDGQSFHVASSSCCYSFVKQRIKLNQIQCYSDTSSTCPYKAVILKLKGGRKACASETEAWVQSLSGKMKPCL